LAQAGKLNCAGKSAAAWRADRSAEALGSISFVLALAELPVGMATGISVSYVLLVMLLSRIFLNESMTLMKISGALLTLIGVALLSWQQK